jgi:hypothetical protein
LKDPSPGPPESKRSAIFLVRSIPSEEEAEVAWEMAVKVMSKSVAREIERYLRIITHSSPERSAMAWQKTHIRIDPSEGIACYDLCLLRTCFDDGKEL